MEENSTMPIEFKDTKNNIKIVITEQTDVISVSCICNHKEYILQCITDPSFQQKNSPYIAIIQPGQKTIDNSFEEPLMWINEKIQTADFLPDTKKKILSTLITNFPLFNDYKKIDIENLLQDTKFYDTKRKEIYNILKENIDNFESLSDVTKEISSHIKKAKNINKKTEIENICKAIVQETNI